MLLRGSSGHPSLGRVSVGARCHRHYGIVYYCRVPRWMEFIAGFLVGSMSTYSSTATDVIPLEAVFQVDFGPSGFLVYKYTVYSRCWPDNSQLKAHSGLITSLGLVISVFRMIISVIIGDFRIFDNCLEFYIDICFFNLRISFALNLLIIACRC